MGSESIDARIRVRPLRLGFLVKPNDPAALRRAIEVCTCLWGGKFNFIVPAFHRIPHRYLDRPFRGPTAREFIAGLLEAFEPDFLVETEPGLAASLTFAEKRIIGIDDVFRRDENGRGARGADDGRASRVRRCRLPACPPPAELGSFRRSDAVDLGDRRVFESDRRLARAAGRCRPLPTSTRRCPTARNCSSSSRPYTDSRTSPRSESWAFTRRRWTIRPTLTAIS